MNMWRFACKVGNVWNGQSHFIKQPSNLNMCLSLTIVQQNGTVPIWEQWYVNKHNTDNNVDTNQFLTRQFVSIVHCNMETHGLSRIYIFIYTSW